MVACDFCQCEEIAEYVALLLVVSSLAKSQQHYLCIRVPKRSVVQADDEGMAVPGQEEGNSSSTERSYQRDLQVAGSLSRSLLRFFFMDLGYRNSNGSYSEVCIYR